MRRIGIFSLLLCCLALNARGQLGPGSAFAVAFTTNGFLPETQHSSFVYVTPEGLRLKQLTYYPGTQWVESQRIEVDSHWASPRNADLILTIKGKHHSFPSESFFRYSADGSHWTSWQPFREVSTDVAHSELRTLEGKAAMPESQYSQFETYRQEWRKEVDAKGGNRCNDSEQDVAEWVQKHDPRYLEDHIPFIRYVQVRFEGPPDTDGASSPHKDLVVMSEAFLKANYGVGGFRCLFR